MKIVIPTNNKNGLGDKVAEHFGRCLTYTFLDETGKVIKVIENTSEHMGGSGLPPELMKKNGADVLLCGGIGPKAIDLCKEFGIDVYVSKAKLVKEVFEEWLNEGLEPVSSEDCCKQHKTGR